MISVSVVGGGSWATALVKILSNNAGQIHWWIRNPESVDFIRQYRHNPSYLSEVEIDLSRVVPNANLAETLAASDYIVLAVPAAFLKTALSGIPADALKGKKVS